EIFCLEPYEAINEYSTIMNKKGSVRWKCMIGGASKWNASLKSLVLSRESAVPAPGSRLRTIDLTLKAILVEKLPNAYVVEFSWEPAELSFAEVIGQAGD